MTRIRRWIVAAFLGAMLLLLVKFLATGKQASEAVAHEPPQVRPSSASDAQAPSPAVPVPVQPGSATQFQPPGLSERARRMQADWCGFGAKELAAEQAKHFEGKEMIGPAEIAEQAAKPKGEGEQVLALAREEVVQRWIHALRQRGEPRALALAEFLGASGVGSKARLQAMALSSTDPMLTALALQRLCDPGACRNVEASQWSRLEPENVYAWLQMLSEPGQKQTQGAYLLERMATQARYARGYQQEVGQLLVSVLQAGAPGLAHQAETESLMGVLAAWPIPSFSTLMRLCRESPGQPGQAMRCEAVAAAVWSQGHILDRLIALALARVVAPKSTPQRPLWERRALEFEAVQSYEDERRRRELEAMSMPADAESNYCWGQPLMRTLIQDYAIRHDWDEARAHLHAEGADLNAWAKRWRDSNGRGVLDPMPQNSEK
ncbi:hypothetical protein [Paucibacter sp. KBW04]|uniref:hypothetical protein n=1 Tax=Paucibacter sp. KBW04 TaxID=2153361 RepID=UPI000F570399|nr:hypothetical protein [Paucibacter sp. KBW04]